MIPKFMDRLSDVACEFRHEFSKGYVLDKSDFIFGESQQSGRNEIADVVVQTHSGWHIEKANVYIHRDSISIECRSDAHAVRLAHPIDPRMKKSDIVGATRIYPNATNNGWLFAHADTEHHHERVILLEAIMHTLFEDLVHGKLTDVLKAVVGHNNPSPPIGTALLYNYNAQSGSLANYQTLVEFRKECVKWCSEVEKLLFLGQHVQEDDHWLKHQILRAIKQAKAVWKADTEGKARNLAAIEPQVNAIIARVEAEHEIETRWAKVARQEAAAKAIADAANSETETENA